MYAPKAHELAHNLRAAILSVPCASRPIGLTRFPHGACGDASLLLHSLLVDAGEEGSIVVAGERGSVDDGTWTTHAWVEINGNVLDITSDQFEDGAPGRIFGPAGPFHDSFKVDGRESATVFGYFGPSMGELQGFYLMLRKTILGR